MTHLSLRLLEISYEIIFESHNHNYFLSGDHEILINVKTMKKLRKQNYY